MIIKANKQIGFIYKNNESIDKILKDGNVVFEKGFLREKTSTTLPITFGGVGKNLKDYKIYGNTYQNSTSGKNLLGFGTTNNGKGTQTTYDEKTGLMTTVGTTTASYPWSNEFGVNIPSGTSLTISSNSQYQIIARLYYDSSNYEEINSTTGSTRTLTHDIIKIALLINIRANITINETYYVQIEKGTTATNFEPYTNGVSPNPDYPQEIVSCGDRTKNLFDKDSVDITSDKYLTQTGTTTGDIAWLITPYIEVKSGENYVYQGITRAGNAPYSCYYDSSKALVSSFKQATGTNTITIPNGVSYVRFSIMNNDTYPDAQTFMIEKGSTATSYEPYGYKIPVNVNNVITNVYLDEPLRKIGDYSDYIDFINGKLYRKIKEHIFKGTNDDSYAFNTDNTNTLAINIYPEKNQQPAIKTSTNPKIYSDMFNFVAVVSDIEHIYLTNATVIDVGYRSAIRIYVNKSRLNGYSSTMTNNQKKELVQTWLQTNNLTTNYIAYTPTEETITLPNIPTTDGNNTLNIETEITPSQVYIKYKSNT